MDCQIINYGRFYPAKLLGSTLLVSNLTRYEQIVELSVDSNTKTYPGVSIKERCAGSDMPFDDIQATSDRPGFYDQPIENSENAYNAWFIENPISKELTKRITLKLGPKAEQEFIIVVRSPSSLKKSTNLVSQISITLLTLDGERFGVAQSFDEFLRKNHNNNMREFLTERKKLMPNVKMEVLLAGRVEVPRITCPRTLNIKQEVETPANFEIVPLAVKKGT